MITLMIFIMGMMIMWSMKTLNPVKVSMSILSMSTILFFFIGVSSSMTWFAIILLMLFMGGIILMFMILSSILPNEKSVKTKGIMTIILGLVTMMIMSPMSKSLEMTSTNVKTFLMSGNNFFFMMSIILFYFLSSMSILSAEQTPMRSIYCH